MLRNHMLACLNKGSRNSARSQHPASLHVALSLREAADQSGMRLVQASLRNRLSACLLQHRLPKALATLVDGDVSM